MKSKTITIFLSLVAGLFLFTHCGDSKSNDSKNADNKNVAAAETPKSNYGGFESQVKWGEHLVTICGCNDCHTPKKMGPQGPEPDMSLMLSGHPEKMPAPDVNRKDFEKKGMVVTQDLTAWVGPWGISYSGNLTSDVTGIGGWQEAAFINALRKGKYKGMDSARDLLPPMPWQDFKNMTDDELKAIFAFLKSTPPIKNLVPQPTPPASAGS